MEMPEGTAVSFDVRLDLSALAHRDLSLLQAVINAFPGLVTPITETPGGTLAVLVGPDRVATLRHEDWWYRNGAWETTSLTLSGKAGPLTRARYTRALTERRTLAREVIGATLRRPSSRLSFLLHGPAEQQDRAHFLAMASLWHDLRVREGHTPESAFFLLTLHVSPPRAGYLSLDPTTARLVLAPTTPQSIAR